MNNIGFDIFHGDADPDFHALKATGADFVILKATQGITGVDSTYADRYARAKSVGLLVGAYHFMDPKRDPIAQAKHFLNIAHLVSGDIRWALDVETAGPDTGVNTTGLGALSCAQQIKKDTGIWPMVYSGDSFFQQYLIHQFPPQDYLLWIARYGQRPVTPCILWQNSETAQVRGIAGKVDEDTFTGTLDDFKKKVCIP